MSLPKDILQNWNILIVEDEPYNLDVVVRILKNYSANVLTATNGLEGIEQVKTNRPDIIISDLSMPIMDGWEMINQLKGNPETKSIPIIALTAHAMVGDRDRALAAGCHSYLTKPISPTTFISELVGIMKQIPELNFDI